MPSQKSRGEDVFEGAIAEDRYKSNRSYPGCIDAITLILRLLYSKIRLKADD